MLACALKLLTATVPADRLGSAHGVFVAGLHIGTVVAFGVIRPLAGGQG